MIWHWVHSESCKVTEQHNFHPLSHLSISLWTFSFNLFWVLCIIKFHNPVISPTRTTVILAGTVVYWYMSCCCRSFKYDPLTALVNFIAVTRGETDYKSSLSVCSFTLRGTGLSRSNKPLQSKAWVRSLFNIISSLTPVYLLVECLDIKPSIP